MGPGQRGAGRYVGEMVGLWEVAWFWEGGIAQSRVRFGGAKNSPFRVRAYEKHCPGG